ncbi:MAG: HesA/MoeB/ThiF family protein [Acidithiobacillales bacterium]
MDTAPEMTPDPRLDRQLRIQDWDQEALERARIAVFGDNDLLASLYVLSAAALGLNDIVLMAPSWDRPLLDLARRVNPKLRLVLLEGLYTHPILDEIFSPCAAIVDLTRYALANKLLLEKSFRSDVPVVRGFCRTGSGREGLTVFAYRKGREWHELWDLVSPSNLPTEHFDDGALDLVAAGIALEETKNVLMERRLSEDAIAYDRPTMPARGAEPSVAIVGAGALGNFVGLGLAFAGLRSITVIDPDTVDVTNLNRQVLLAGGIGRTKAEVLCERLHALFGIETGARVASFRKDTEVSGYDAIFDCVDNFETRVILSETCRDERKVLISGGTGPREGQVIVFDPARGNETPAEVLGMHEIVDRQAVEAFRRDTASCAYRPEPSVVMTNQIVGGLMVDSFRMLLAGQEPRNTFYDAGNDARIFV